MSRSLNLTIPEHCAHYKFFLVEEISLWPHPASAHYGIPFYLITIIVRIKI